MAEKFTVGVTGNSKRVSPSWICTRLALALVGARAARISVRHDPPREQLQALVIGGGDDISPEHYGHDITARVRPDPARDELEIRWIKWALEREIPMLGICRGAQLINVVLGGTLHQDIRPLRKRTRNRPGLLPTKRVDLEPDSLICTLTKSPLLRVNSLHSQAVDRVGQNLRVVGRDLDGIVQAIQATNARPVIGVQWHPEYLFYLPKQLALFRWLRLCQGC
ncbi:MAG: gamma-glutamyl-gamma-aminobutyrate hydrolase family protein [Pseudohongiellaceae bacterium]|jgi:putative glutamine amidotransferase